MNIPHGSQNGLTASLLEGEALSGLPQFPDVPP